MQSFRASNRHEQKAAHADPYTVERRVASGAALRGYALGALSRSGHLHGALWITKRQEVRIVGKPMSNIAIKQHDLAL